MVVYVREIRKPSAQLTKALFEAYLWHFLMETLRDRRNVPESSSKTSSAAGPQAHSRVARFSGSSESSDCESVPRMDVLPALFAWDNLDSSACIKTKDFNFL